MELTSNNFLQFLKKDEFLSNNFYNNFYQDRERMTKQETFNLLKQIYYKKINKIDDNIIKNSNGFNFNNIILDGSKGINQILEGEEIKQLIDGKRIDAKIYERITLVNSLNDTSELNWYEDKREINEDEILKLSNDFCDNILLYFIDGFITENDEGKIITKAKHINKYQNLINDFFVSFGYKRCIDFKAKLIRMDKYNTDKYKDKNISYTIKNEELKLYNLNNNEDVKDTTLLIKQYVKISLSNIDIHELLKILSSQKNKDFLQRNLIFFHDFDATLDIAGAFNKEGLINIMLQDDNFYIEQYEKENELKKKQIKEDLKIENDLYNEEENLKNINLQEKGNILNQINKTRATKKDNIKQRLKKIENEKKKIENKKIKVEEQEKKRENEKIKELYKNEKYLNKPLEDQEGIIFKNNNLVGKHCLSFMFNLGNNKVIRCKFYDKFIDNYETLGVSSNIGSNIKNWGFNDTDTRLQETVLKGKDYGILRLETTFKFLPDINDINKVNDILFNLLQQAKKTYDYFYCNISTMWTNLLKNSIKENLILVNTKERDIYYIRSINKLTNKISGLFITGKKGIKKLSNNNNIEVFKSNLCKIMSYLTFKNLPVNIINIIKDKDDKGITKTLVLNLNTYNIKLDTNPLSEFIFLTNGKMELGRCIKKDNEKFNYTHKLEDTGIINYNNYKFMIPYNDKIKNYKISYLSLERTNITKIINIISTKNLNKILINEKDEQEKELLKQQMIDEAIKQREKFLLREKIKDELDKQLITLINIYKSYTNNKDVKDTLMKNLKEINKDEIFYIISYKKYVGKDGFLLLIKYNDEYFKMYSNTIITSYLNKIIENPRNDNKFNNVMDCNFFIRDFKIQEILTVKKEGSEKSMKGFTYDKLNIKCNTLLYREKEEEIKTNTDLMKYEETGNKLKDCFKMEEKLNENTNYLITKYEMKLHGQKKKYIIDVKDDTIQGINNIYDNIISNEYLEDLLNKLLNDNYDLLNNTPYIKMKTLKLNSNNKSKKRLMEVVLNINEEYIKNLDELKILKQDGENKLNTMENDLKEKKEKNIKYKEKQKKYINNPYYKNVSEEDKLMDDDD